MKETQNRPDTRPDTRPDRTAKPQESSTGRGIEEALGGALSRVLERAGLDVRVVHTTAPAAEEGAQAAPSESTAQAAPPAQALPHRDALLTLVALALGRELLAAAPAPAEAVSEPAPEPAPEPVLPPAQCDRLSDLLRPAEPGEVVSLAPVTVPGRPVSVGTPLAPSPIRPATAQPTARPAPGRGRNVTIRY